MSHSYSHSASDGERNGCEQDDAQMLSENVATDKFYDSDTIIRIENDFVRDQNQSEKPDYLYEANDSLELENQTRKIKEEPSDAWPETVTSPSECSPVEMDMMNAVYPDVIIKEEVVEEDEETLASSLYHFQTMPEQQDSGEFDGPFRTVVKYEDTSQIYENERSSHFGDASLSELAELAGSSSKEGGSGSQQSEVYYDQNRVRLVDVSMLLEDIVPKNSVMKSQRLFAKESSTKSHSRTYSRRRSKLPKEMEIPADIRRLQKSHGADTNIQEHFVESVSKEWHPCTLCLVRFKFVSSLTRHYALTHYVHYCVECEAIFRLKSDLHAHSSTHSVKKLHSCPYCLFKCTSPTKLKTHARIHPNKQLFSCGQCFAVFDKSDGLFTHILTHSDAKRFGCAHCSLTFRRKSDIKAHLLNHTNERPHKCAYCEATFKWTNSLRHHEQACHNGEKFRCAECSATCSNKQALKRHLCMQHRKAISCTFCPEKFKNRSALKYHVTSLHSGEEPSFSCSYNPSSFKRMASLEKHTEQRDTVKQSSFTSHADNVWLEHYQRTQSGEALFSCPYCSFTSVTQRSLAEHLSTHTSEKSLFGAGVASNSNLTHQVIHAHKKLFSCSECGLAFQSEDDLKRHLSFHTDATVTLFSCEHCPAKFKFKYNFEKHLIVHTQGRTFVCDICPARFSYKSHLVQHQKIHNRERFSCPFCSLKFLREIYLKIHLTTHSDRMLTCPDCSTQFRTKSDLELHQLSHNEKEPFLCFFCSRRFETKQTLDSHTMVCRRLFMHNYAAPD